METLKAIITNRFQVLARYTNEVLVPTFMREKEKVHGADVDGVKNLLVRETSLLDVTAKQRLADFWPRTKRFSKPINLKNAFKVYGVKPRYKKAIS